MCLSAIIPQEFSTDLNSHKYETKISPVDEKVSARINNTSNNTVLGYFHPLFITFYCVLITISLFHFDFL